MTGAEHVIRWSTAGAVLGVAAVAAAASYEHAYELVRAHGEAGWTARLVPLTVDGLIYASSMVMLDSARRKTPRSRPGAVAARAGHRGDARGQRRPRPGARPDRRGGRRVAGGRPGRLLRAADDGDPRFPVRNARDARGHPGPAMRGCGQAFADQLAADRVPSVRAIRSQLHVGQPRPSGCGTTSPQEPKDGQGEWPRYELCRRPMLEAERSASIRRYLKPGFGCLRCNRR